VRRRECVLLEAGAEVICVFILLIYVYVLQTNFNLKF